jgi:hypothetical protein
VRDGFGSWLECLFRSDVFLIFEILFARRRGSAAKGAPLLVSPWTDLPCGHERIRSFCPAPTGSFFAMHRLASFAMHRLANGSD